MIMKNVVLYIAMSLDGYIADSNMGVDWLSGDGSQPDSVGTYLKFLESIDTVVLGYSTYHQIVTDLSPDEWVYSGMKSYVMTHRNEPSSDEIIFTSRNIVELLQELKSEEGKDIWICGGASIVNQLLECNMIDRYHIAIIPTILGGGVPLFEKHDKKIDLRLISTECYNGIVEIIYERR